MLVVGLSNATCESWRAVDSVRQIRNTRVGQEDCGANADTLCRYHWSSNVDRVTIFLPESICAASAVELRSRSGGMTIGDHALYITLGLPRTIKAHLIEVAADWRQDSSVSFATF